MGRDYANREMTIWYDPDSGEPHHEDEPVAWTFKVAAFGSLAILQPYELAVSLDYKGIQIGDVRMTWNEAYACFESCASTNAALRVLAAKHESKKRKRAK